MITSATSATSATSKLQAVLPREPGSQVHPVAGEQPLLFTRPKVNVDGASRSTIASIYDLKNPADVELKKKNDALAAMTGPLVRSLKTKSDVHGDCVFRYKGLGYFLGDLTGTSKNHTVRFSASGSPMVVIKSGEIASHRGVLTPETLNHQLTRLIEALHEADDL